MARPEPQGRQGPPGSPRSRSRGGRPGGGTGSQLPRGDHRHAGRSVAGCHLVLVLPRLRRHGSRRSIRSDRTQGADRRRRVPLRGQGHPTRDHDSLGAGCDTGSRPRRGDRLHRGAIGSREALDRLDGSRSGRRRAGRVRPTALRSSALHHVLIGHHRTAQEHRPRGRWGAVEAPLRTQDHLRSASGRSDLLVHHLRVDDVELAHQHAGIGGDGRALRRQSRPSRSGHAVATRRRAPHHPSRLQSQIPAHLCQQRHRAPRSRRPLFDQVDGIDRSPPQSRSVRLDLRERQHRGERVIDHRGHRPPRRLGRRRFDPAGAARRDHRPLAGDGGRLLR